MSKLTHLSLFSGIGGLDLAAEMAGIETVGQCEFADYPTRVLELHWPNVPRWRDIRTLTGESFYERTGLRTVDIISGGFPCQPFSVAGKQKGKGDDRYLWPEMLRVISEVKPAWVIGENVLGIVDLALDQVLSDLEGSGYEAQAFAVPACAVDAPHKRYRVAIIGCRLDDGIRKPLYAVDADPGCNGLQRCTRVEVLRGREDSLQAMRNGGSHPARENWPSEPGMGRVVNGLSHRMDRIKCLGNAVVPQQFYPFFAAIAAIYEGRSEL